MSKFGVLSIGITVGVVACSVGLIVFDLLMLATGAYTDE
jgi:hypothetical protein